MLTVLFRNVVLLNINGKPMISEMPKNDRIKRNRYGIRTNRILSDNRLAPKGIGSSKDLKPLLFIIW